ncbi:MAG: hypothetical protein ABR501_07785, partial [Pyrinomonadaceae bacterium]
MAPNARVQALNARAADHCAPEAHTAVVGDHCALAVQTAAVGDHCALAVQTAAADLRFAHDVPASPHAPALPVTES